MTSGPLSLGHGLVGDGRVLALVAPDSGVEWLCLPRFDSPSIFAALLDRERGGVFRVVGRPVSAVYVPDTNVLLTELAVDGGRLTITDFCAAGRFFRRVVGIPSAPGGTVSARVVFDPQPDYARRPAHARPCPEGLQIDDGLVLHTDCADALLAGDLVDFGRPREFVLGRPVEVDFEATLERRLRADARYARRFPPAVRRDALVLRAHTYRPTGAIIAAATTSIPEAIGTPRTWDYRYCWIRDGAFAAAALLSLGDARTPTRFLTFLQETVGDDRPQPLYGVGGERDLPESTLPHLAGYANTGPVRIGNAAALQVQNDSYGQIIWLAERCVAAGHRLDDGQYAWLCVQAEHAIAVGATPDCGIWEFRDRPGRYTFSQLWRWIAMDRMARLAAGRGDPREPTWRAAAIAIRENLLTAARRVGFFAQTLDDDVVDASSLTVAAMGLVAPDDPLFHATIDHCERVLVADGLMRRYIEEDDFGSTTSTFGLCTLWWVEALALAGRRDAAHAALARFLAHANPLGLFAEDIEPGTGRRLGNFPQVYSHTGLITAHLALHPAAPLAHQITPRA